MKILKEWHIKAPWGKIEMVSWGKPNGEPVLLVHGRQDSLDTFLPLLALLPDRYHYVGLDLPGHGKSDALPVGVMLTRLAPLVAIDTVIKHLKWKKFVYMGHSLGAELGLFYNVIYPDKITKLILLDVKPALQRLQIVNLPHYFKAFYGQYYNNYAGYNVDDRTYTKEQALQAVMKARGLTRDQAEVILSRNLKSIGDDRYKLSWDKRLKIMAPTNSQWEYYAEIFSVNPPPCLYINAKASNGQFYAEGKDAVDKIFVHLQRNARHLYTIDVEGSHDVHFTYPERMGKEICAFLVKDFSCKSKL